MRYGIPHLGYQFLGLWEEQALGQRSEQDYFENRRLLYLSDGQYMRALTFQKSSMMRLTHGRRIVT